MLDALLLKHHTNMLRDNVAVSDCCVYIAQLFDIGWAPVSAYFVQKLFKNKYAMVTNMRGLSQPVTTLYNPYGHVLAGM